MISFCAGLNVIVSLFGILTAVRSLRSGRFGLLPIYLLVYIVTNGLGISFSFLPQLNQHIWNSMYDTMVQPLDYLALCISTWVFVLLGSFLILRSRPDRLALNKTSLKLPSDISLTLSALILFAAIALYLKFMILGPGFTMARETSYFHYDVDAEYQFRKEFDAQLQQGQGMLMATVAAFCLFPLATFFAVMSRKAFALVASIGGFSFACSFLFSFALRQKAPVLLILLVYGLIYLHYARRTLLSKVLAKLVDARILAIGGMLFLTGLTFFYQITEGETIPEAIGHSFYRIFLVPVASDQAWFLVFPEVYPFRGVVGIFDTAFYDPNTSPVGVYDVSGVLTGYQFSLNASMLAVAWSAAGYLGVVLISLIFCLGAYLIDRQLVRLDPGLLYPIIIIALPSLLAVTSTSFFDFVVKGGFVSQLVIAWAFRAFGRPELVADRVNHGSAAHQGSERRFLEKESMGYQFAPPDSQGSR